jgi:subtilisin family serine protease
MPSAPSVIPKLDPTLRAWLTRNPAARVPVLIYLADQPIYRIRPRLERQHAFRRLVLEENSMQAIRNGDLRVIEAARRAEALFTLDFRRELLRAAETEAGENRRAVESTLMQLGGRDVGRFNVLNLLRGDVPVSAIEVLAADPRIAEIGLNPKTRPHLVTSVPALGTYSFWSRGVTGVGESVLVTDSGIKADHPAFSGRVTASVFLDHNSFCSSFERVTSADFNGHGTHVAGIIASVGTPAFPNYLGVAPGLTAIYAAKVSCASGDSFASDILLAVETALTWAPFSVINNSNGADTAVDDDFFSRRVDELVDIYNLTWVNSAGNDGPNPYTIRTPATAYNILAVGAVDTHGSVNRSLAGIAAFSSRGPTTAGRFKPDLVAPGVHIMSAAHDSNGFVAKDGTSMASPHIAGAAALLRQRGVRDRLQIKAILINTTDTSGWDSAWGWGYANLHRASDEAGLSLTGNVPQARGSVLLYKGTLPANTSLFGTLVWNRWILNGLSHVRDLDLAAYRQSDGAVLDSSASVAQNVEQFSTPPLPEITPVVVSVEGYSAGAGFMEPFALALSRGGFVPAAGFLLTTNCSVPPTVLPSSLFQVSCTFHNNGDLPSTDSAFQAGMASAQGQSWQSLGQIGAGQSISRSFSLTAPSTAGPATVVITFGGYGFGVSAVAPEALYSIQVSGGPTAIALSKSIDAAPMSGSAGRTVSVAAAAGIVWFATPTAGWITVTAGSPGSGNGTIAYNVAPNPNTSSRSGTIIVGSQTLTISQAGPTSVSTGPIAGSGASHVFTLQFTHPNGFDKLDVVNALFNRYLDGNRACYIAYSQTAKVLYLVNDNGPGSGISAGLVLGASGSVSNSQCTIYSAGSSAAGSGIALTLKLNIQFKSAFNGSRVLYLAARDASGGNSGWFTQGVWTVPGAPISYPLAASVAPSAGISTAATINYLFDDQTSANNLKTVWALINTSIDGRRACYVAYYVPGNRLYLYPDNGDGTQAASIALTGTNTIENSQCRISAIGSSVTKSGQRLALLLNMQFKYGFTGPRGIWTAAQTLTDALSPWTALGNWLVP